MLDTYQLLNLAFVGLSLIGSSQAQNNVANKNTLFPNGLGGINKAGLFDAYPLNAVTKKVQKPYGSVPTFCYTAANPSNATSGGQYCNPYDIEVFDVTFADCSASWTFCRCKTSSWTYDDMVNVFGRVPVKARSYTRTFAMYPDSATNAYAQSQSVVIFDNSAKNGIDMTLILHENAHCVDGGSGGLSSNQAYVNAINADTCVPDYYAKSNNVENWAQLSVLSNLDLSKTGPLSRYANPACLSNQLKYVETTVGRDRLLPGGSCSFYYIKDTYVCMGPAAGCGRAGAPVASPASRDAAPLAGLPSRHAPEWDAIHEDAEHVARDAAKLAQAFES